MPNNINTLIDVMMATQRVVHRQSRLAARTHPFTFMTFRILRLVSDAKEPLTMHDISTCLGITPPSATAMVQKLVRKEYLRRSQDPNDRRRIQLHITPSGKKTMGKSLTAIREEMKKPFMLLSNADRQSLIRIFRKIAGAYSNMPDKDINIRKNNQKA